jgi:hypothetical protein
MNSCAELKENPTLRQERLLNPAILNSSSRKFLIFLVKWICLEKEIPVEFKGMHERALAQGFIVSCQNRRIELKEYKLVSRHFTFLHDASNSTSCKFPSYRRPPRKH